MSEPDQRNPSTAPSPWLRPCPGADGMRALDRWAIEDQGVPSLELMEAAGRELAERTAAVAGGGSVRIVCGKGNNGGDGLVAARHLDRAGFDVDALLLCEPAELTGDAAANLARHPGARRVETAGLGGELGGSAAIVDALLGTGFSGEPLEPVSSAIAAINAAGAPVVAADIASGVDASTGEVRGGAVYADVTVSFHAPMLGQLIAPGKGHTGRLDVVPIGIPSGGPVDPHSGIIERSVLALAPRRGPDSTKFTSGQVVIAGGSRGLTGAVCLSAMAAMRAGAGYVTAAVPSDLEHIVEIKLTEAMTVGCASREGRLRAAASEQILAASERAACVLVGPGIGDDPATSRLVRDLAERIAVPLVLDADGLRAFRGELGRLADRRAPTVLTPHSGELAGLLGLDSGEVSSRRLWSAREAARVSGSIVVHKGDDTIILDGERVAVNEVSAPALATAGTGDVLAGMIAAMIARGLEPFTATCAAVLAHARAGRLAAEQAGAAESVVAGDVVERIAGGLAP